jgi:ElaB/YqjD/DUF883 family membrane-anchored ribosome-binding protein
MFRAYARRNDRLRAHLTLRLPLTGKDVMSNTEHALRSAADDIARRGAAAVRDTKAGLDDAVETASETGRQALRGAREVRDTFDDAIRNSVRAHPYTALTIAGLIGFAYAVVRRR